MASPNVRSTAADTVMRKSFAACCRRASRTHAEKLRSGAMRIRAAWASFTNAKKPAEHFTFCIQVA